MATIKIILDKNESSDDIEENLIKAFQSKNNDKIFEKRFDDHLMNLLSEEIDGKFKEMYVSLINEIIEIISDGNQ